MSAPINKPCFVAGTPRSSGDVQTGEVTVTRGGGRAACVWSGSLLTNAALTGAPGAVQSGAHVLLFSGAGRINTVVQHQNVLTLSGVAVNIYDAGSIAPSGVSVSGQRLLAVLNAPGGVSGQFTLSTVPFAVDMPFSSGLCVSAPSGSPGFTVSYTAEVVEPAFPRAG
jgi:hypothetical protein